MQLHRPHFFVFSSFRTFVIAPIAPLIALLAAVLLTGGAAAQAQQPNMLEITAATANVMSGSDVIATVRAGQQYKILEARPPWYKIAVQVDGAARQGWISEESIKLLEPTPPAALPTVPEALRITAAEGQVMSGPAQVATVRKGEIYRPLATNGRWVKIDARSPGGMLVNGWLYDTAFERLPANFAEPGQAGFEPASITEATLAVDWQTQQVTLSAAVPLLAEEAPLSAASSEGIEVRRTAAGIELVVAGDELPGLLAPGTRSLWVREGQGEAARHHRIDLPGVELGAALQAYKYPNFTEGLVLFLPVDALLPGYVLEFGERRLGGGVDNLLPVPRETGLLPRLSDLYTDPRGQQFIRVILPFISDEKYATTYHFRVRRADGARSGVIAVSRRGDDVNKTAAVVTGAPAALVDAVLPMPSVELMDAFAAADVLRHVGLQPQLVGHELLQPLAAADLAGGLVMRQGVPARNSVLLGQRVLLAVASDQQLSGTGQSPFDASLAVAQLTWPELPSAIDTGEQLGFISLPQSDPLASGGQGPLVGTQAQPPTDTTIDDSNLPPGLIETGPPLDVADAGPGDFPTVQQTLPGGPPSMPGGSAGGGSIVLLATDPGVSIDPDADAQHDLLAAILKLILDALAVQPSGASLPGSIGAAIDEAISAHETALVAAIQAGKPGEMPIEQVLDITLKHLAVELNAAERAQLLADWQLYIATHPAPWQLDRNYDHRLADDVVVWMVVWLFQHGHYNPASQVVVLPGTDGTPLAIFPSTPPSPDWVNTVEPPIVTPGTPPALGGQTQTTQTTVTTTDDGQLEVTEETVTVASLPTGPAEATAGDGPDQVRVPEVVEVQVATVDERFDALGLNIANVSEVFESDKVIDSAPRQLTWVDSGSAVELDVHRRVPPVERYSLARAQDIIRRWRLTPKPPSKSVSSDVVFEQSPEEGTYVPPRSDVNLTVRVVVPPLVGDTQEVAQGKLADRDLGWRADTKAFKVDKVVAQEPRAGSLVEHGEKVKLTLHLPVPRVTDRTLAKARAVLLDWDLVIDVPNQYAHEEDMVRGQRPAPGTFVPHQSTATVDPVKGVVPDVSGQSVETASQRLRNVEHYGAAPYGNLLGSDIVQRTQPPAGEELERGKTITLDARVRAPDVYRDNIVAAIRTIQGWEGNLEPAPQGNYARGDVVYSQEPRGGQLIFPRTRIVLVPGVQVPNVIDRAPQEARQAIWDRGLNVGRESSGTQETTNRALAGRTLVSGQRPNAGLYPRPNINAVDLEYTTWILAMRTIPPVAGLEQSVAVARVRAAGFNTNVQVIEARAQAEGQTAPTRYVARYTNPPENTDHVIGTLVTIFVVPDVPAGF